MNGLAVLSPKVPGQVGLLSKAHFLQPMIPAEDQDRPAARKKKFEIGVNKRRKGLSETSYRKRSEPELNLFLTNSVTRKTWEEKANVR